MSLTIKLTKNDISPALTRLARTAQNRTAMLRAMGTTFKSITEGAFNSVGASYRPKEWVPKRDGTPSILQKSTTLAKSFQLEVTGTYARVSNPMIYARIHQLGGIIRPKNKPFLVFQSGGKTWYVKKVTMPARPFFPVAGDKLTPKAEARIAAAAKRVIAAVEKGG